MRHKTNTKFLMLFELSRDHMYKRLLHRAETNDDKRIDDKEEVMISRIDRFEKNLPIFE